MKKKPERAYVIDNKGNRWIWNCGWYLVNVQGVYRRDFKPLTHAVFRKKITLLDPAIKADKEVLHGMDKPGHYWRRFLNREVMSHDQFGSVYVLASDGSHAIVERQDPGHEGEHAKVCVENLTENVGVPLPSRRGGSTQQIAATKKREEKVNSLMAKYTQFALQEDGLN